MSYSDLARHIANRGPSDHETIAILARALRRGRSEPTTAAICEVSLFLGFWAPMEHMVVMYDYQTTIKSLGRLYVTGYVKTGM